MSHTPVVIRRDIVNDMHLINREIANLLQIMKVRPFDREESSKMHTLEQRMKYHAKHHNTEFRAFQQEWGEMQRQLSDTTGLNNTP